MCLPPRLNGPKVMVAASSSGSVTGTPVKTELLRTSCKSSKSSSPSSVTAKTATGSAGTARASPSLDFEILGSEKADGSAGAAGAAASAFNFNTVIDAAMMTSELAHHAMRSIGADSPIPRPPASSLLQRRRGATRSLSLSLAAVGDHHQPKPLLRSLSEANDESNCSSSAASATEGPDRLGHSLHQGGHQWDVGVDKLVTSSGVSPAFMRLRSGSMDHCDGDVASNNNNNNNSVNSSLRVSPALRRVSAASVFTDEDDEEAQLRFADADGEFGNAVFADEMLSSLHQSDKRAASDGAAAAAAAITTTTTTTTTTATTTAASVTATTIDESGALIERYGIGDLDEDPYDSCGMSTEDDTHSDNELDAIFETGARMMEALRTSSRTSSTIQAVHLPAEIQAAAICAATSLTTSPACAEKWSSSAAVACYIQPRPGASRRRHSDDDYNHDDFHGRDDGAGEDGYVSVFRDNDNDDGNYDHDNGMFDGTTGAVEQQQLDRWHPPRSKSIRSSSDMSSGYASAAASSRNTSDSKLRY